MSVAAMQAPTKMPARKYQPKRLDSTDRTTTCTTTTNEKILPLRPKATSTTPISPSRPKAERPERVKQMVTPASPVSEKEKASAQQSRASSATPPSKTPPSSFRATTRSTPTILPGRTSPNESSREIRRRSGTPTPTPSVLRKPMPPPKVRSSPSTVRSPTKDATPRDTPKAASAEATATCCLPRPPVLKYSKLPHRPSYSTTPQPLTGSVLRSPYPQPKSGSSPDPTTPTSPASPITPTTPSRPATLRKVSQPPPSSYHGPPRTSFEGGAPVTERQNSSKRLSSTPKVTTTANKVAPGAPFRSLPYLPPIDTGGSLHLRKLSGNSITSPSPRPSYDSKRSPPLMSPFSSMGILTPPLSSANTLREESASVEPSRPRNKFTSSIKALFSRKRSGSTASTRTADTPTALSFSASNKPKVLRGEGKSARASIQGSINLEPKEARPSLDMKPKADIDVDVAAPVLKLKTVHDSIPIHNLSSMEAPYPFSYEEFALQSQHHTHDLMSTAMNMRVPHFAQIDNTSKIRHVLDLGCGRGIWIQEAVKEWKNASFVGFDLIDEVFPHPNHMRRKLSEAQVSRVKFLQGNLLKPLPFENGQFDFIRMAFVEHAIPESKWSSVISEVSRVLKPGGTFEIITEDLIFPSNADWDMFAVQRHLEDDFLRLLRRRRLLDATERIDELMSGSKFTKPQKHTPLVISKAPTVDRRKRSGSYPRRRSNSGPRSSQDTVSPVHTPMASTSSANLPSSAQMSARNCNMPAIIVGSDVFIPTTEDRLFKYASHSSILLNAARHATFGQLFDVEDEGKWKEYSARFFEYERLMRLRLGIKESQFDDSEAEEEEKKGRRSLSSPAESPRWKWVETEGGDSADKPLKIRSFRAWSSTKPI